MYFDDPVGRRLKTLTPGAQKKTTWRAWWAERLAWASDQEWATALTTSVYGVAAAIAVAIIFVNWWRR